MQHELAILEGDPADDPADSNETMDESDEPLEADMGVQMGCFEGGPEPGPPARKARYIKIPCMAISELDLPASYDHIRDTCTYTTAYPLTRRWSVVCNLLNSGRPRSRAKARQATQALCLKRV